MDRLIDLSTREAPQLWITLHQLRQVCLHVRKLPSILAELLFSKYERHLQIRSFSVSEFLNKDDDLLCSVESLLLSLAEVFPPTASFPAS